MPMFPQRPTPLYPTPRESMVMDDQQDPLDALATLLSGGDASPGMRANDPVKLAGLRNTERLETNDPARKAELTADMASDPYTGTAAQKTNDKSFQHYQDLSQFLSPQETEVRNEQQDYELKKEALGPTIAGNTARDVANINARGAIGAARAKMKPAPGMSRADAYSQERARRSIESIDALIPQVSHMTTGFGSWLKGIPTTPSKSFHTELAKLLSNIASTELTEMRAASATGGALGNVSNQDIELLQNAVAGLKDTAQHPENMLDELNKARVVIERWEAAKLKYGQPGASDDSEWEDIN